MSDKELQEKIAYFTEQRRLDSLDDENDFPDDSYLRIERAFADTKAMPPPPKLVRQKSFLGPTPKERQAEFERKQAEFEAHTKRQRDQARVLEQISLVRSNTAPEADVSRSFPAAKPNGKGAPGRPAERYKLKRNVSLSDLPTPKANVHDEVPFYKGCGVIPREVKLKNAKPADNIVLEREHKQLFKGKIIYFFPNNDISIARRTRIHKLIQLGAAWVTSWRNDITHIMVDEGSYTYMQVLKNINKSEVPKKVILVKFDPYVPQCIEFNTVLPPTAPRFLVKGAPCPTEPEPTTEPAVSQESQRSLQIKQSMRQLAAQSSQKTDSFSVEDSFPPKESATDDTHPYSDVEIVEDSFLSSPARLNSPEAHVESPKFTSAAFDDALAEAIQQAKAVAHLPLDEEDEDEEGKPYLVRGGQVSDSGADEDVPEPAPKRSKRFATGLPLVGSGKSQGFNQQAFQCMDPRATNASAAQNPNARTIQMLEEMCKYYDQMGDHWRTFSYHRGIGVLTKQSSKICTKKQALKLPFIGERLSQKIEEIVLTDRLRRLDSTRDDPTDKVLRTFLGIYGVGLSQAHKWIQAGHRTLDDLVAKVKLTDNQKIGIEHFDDFVTRIPRAEVEAHGEYVRKELRRLDPGFEIIISGSFRRGSKDSGDIDLIITKKGASPSAMGKVVFEKLVPKLFSAGFLKASLATSHTQDGTKWHGASCLPSSKVWRRLDLLLVPEEEMGAALIYFTGNGIFNRSMRLLASKKGMRLNQRGLYTDVMRGKNRENITEGTLLEGKSEKKIFEILGVPWRHPTERIC